jgi:hypothetical protein
VLRRYVHGPGLDEPLVWYEGSGTTDRRHLFADERGSIVAVEGRLGLLAPRSDGRANQARRTLRQAISGLQRLGSFPE